MEAGGVEPPSEKPCHQKPTCLSHSNRDRFARAGPLAEAAQNHRAFAAGGQNGQETPTASPVVLAAASRAETRWPAR